MTEQLICRFETNTKRGIEFHLNNPNVEELAEAYALARRLHNDESTAELLASVHMIARQFAEIDDVCIAMSFAAALNTLIARGVITRSRHTFVGMAPKLGERIIALLNLAGGPKLLEDAV